MPMGIHAGLRGNLGEFGAQLGVGGMGLSKGKEEVGGCSSLGAR